MVAGRKSLLALQTNPNNIRFRVKSSVLEIEACRFRDIAAWNAEPLTAWFA